MQIERFKNYLQSLNDEIASCEDLLNSYYIYRVSAKDKRQKVSIMKYVS